MARAWVPLVLMAAACIGEPGAASDAGFASDAPAGQPGDAPTSATTITVLLAEHAPTTMNLVAAFRDGDGAWKVPGAPVGDAYTFVVTSPTWSFAWGCHATLNFELRSAVTVASFAVAERTSFVAAESCPRYVPVVKISGTITNAPASSSYNMFFGELSGAYLLPQSNGTIKFEISRLAGTHDLYATANDTTSGQGTSVTKVAVSRGFTANANVSNATVNFANAVPTTPPVSVTITGDATSTMASTTLYDPTGTALQLTYSWGGPPHTSRALAASQLQAGSVYEQQIIGRTCTTTYCDEVEAQHWTTSIAAQSVAIPRALGTVTMAAKNGAITGTWPAYPGAVGYLWSALQHTGDVSWSGMLGRAYAGAVPSIAIPDLTNLQGWSEYAPNSSSQFGGRVTAVSSSLGDRDFPPVYPVAAGTERVLASSHLFVPGT